MGRLGDQGKRLNERISRYIEAISSQEPRLERGPKVKEEGQSNPWRLRFINFCLKSIRTVQASACISGGES